MTISNEKRHARRRALGVLSAAAVGALAALSGPVRAQGKATLRIGFQKYGTLTILKARGTLDKRLAAQGIDVKWIEFPAGPQLLEGLNVGSVDFGTVGEAPPIFAQ
ncbi:MAG TPA: sulfonate ABC transporter substrate-binding protein, partial [Burkholderiaceae bacterium]|nr:sulfonate ABC transporter substrate-binding protein [Burkholderiaceae bacterium]